MVSLVKELWFYKPGWTVDPADGCGRAKMDSFLVINLDGGIRKVMIGNVYF